MVVNIADILKKRDNPRKRILTEMGEILNDRNYPKLATKIKGIPLHWVEGWIAESRTKKNPAMHLNWLIKSSKE